MNKKVKLIIEIAIFIVVLCGITSIYYFNNRNKKQLEEEASSVGIVKVTDGNFNSEVLESDKPVIVEFTSNSCPPCISLLPTLINIAKTNSDVKVVTINIDSKENKSVVTKYQVEATPTIIIFKEGKVKDSIIGATDEESIMTALNK
ncbi:MAG TPA: thiol reductase thioredoxin [Firmicutes bacterium]|nr:thiol reductase thioredoxin [Bacillota bacterium]